jgi:hypothetical protein
MGSLVDLQTLSDSRSCNSSCNASLHEELTCSNLVIYLEHSKVKFHGDSVPESIVTSDIFILHACASGAQSSLEFLKPANMSWPSELNFVSVAILSPRRNTSA